MKNILLLAMFGVALSACVGSNESIKQDATNPVAEEKVIVHEETFAYDSVYAAKLGADDYGMKSYVMAFLKSGPNRPEDPTLKDSLQSAHLANIEKLADEGKLVLAGPFFGGDELRGVYVFDTDSIEEAASWTATDPAIIYGSLEMELKKRYRSAAQVDVNNLHKKAAKINF